MTVEYKDYIIPQSILELASTGGKTVQNNKSNTIQEIDEEALTVFLVCSTQFSSKLCYSRFVFLSHYSVKLFSFVLLWTLILTTALLTVRLLTVQVL